MSGPEILSLGEAMAEFTRTEVPGQGLLWRLGTGGDTSNAMVSAARQGARAGYVSALGDDLFAEALREMWAEEGVDDSGVATDPEAPTGVYFVRPHPSGRDFTYLRQGSAASRLGPDALPADLIRGARVLHVSAISQAVSGRMREAVDAAIDLARGAGATVSFDTNLRLKLWNLETAKAAIFGALARAEICFPSDDEARLLTGLEDDDRVIDRFLEAGPRLVVLKRGARGAVVATAEGRTEIPPAPSTPVDSTGAGDSFAGAFLAYWLETGDAVLAARRAAQVAAGTVSGMGAIAPIPRRADILKEET